MADTGEATGAREIFMRRAIDIGTVSMRDNRGGPFGAVIVKEGRIIGEGTNEVLSEGDPTAHAEVQAIRAACRALATFSLEGCEIYTSCEPCPMCLSAIYWARLDRIWYANSRQDAAAIGFDDAHIYDEVAMAIDQRDIPTERLLANEAIEAFDAWEKKSDKTPY